MGETIEVQRHVIHSLLTSSVISQDASSPFFKGNTQNGYIRMNQDKAPT